MLPFNRHALIIAEHCKLNLLTFFSEVTVIQRKDTTREELHYFQGAFDAPLWACLQRKKRNVKDLPEEAMHYF